MLPKNRKCVRPTHYPFWKKPIDVRNRVETRAQISLKPKATRDYVKRYMHYLNVFSEEYFSSDDNLTSDDESITGNVSDTEQNLSSKDETIISNTLNTGEDLILMKILRQLSNQIILHKLARSLTHKIQTIKMKQIIKPYL